ncbi:MAG: UDP-glucose 4-epimerase GalE [Gammaproteobacteria bacterium]
MSCKKILLTGGAGYIGSHVVKLLGAHGYELVILDNLVTGNAEAVLYGELVIGDVGDTELVSQLLHYHNIDTVMHFAAHTCVPESVTNPLKYYHNNTCNSNMLLKCCQDAKVKRFIFSSTAAVYGMPQDGIASEATPTIPINPYGTSKLMTEWMLRDVSKATEMTYVILRYFNVAGCDPEGKIGHSTPNSTLLIKVACETAVGKRSYLSIFGTDFPTPDGTGVRDYIHVEDLADAHLKALEYLITGGESITLNCGYGHGYSVREVLAAVEHAHGASLPTCNEECRLGDPPKLIAAADQIRDRLGWEPRYDNLNFIAQTALNWEKKKLHQSARLQHP